MDSDFLQILLRRKKLAYIVADADFRVLEYGGESPLLNDPAPDKSLFELVPELVEWESDEMLQDVLHCRLLACTFTLENIHRCDALGNATTYLTLDVLSHSQPSGAPKLLLILCDTSETAQIQQTLTQQRNDLMLLKYRLDQEIVAHLRTEAALRHSEAELRQANQELGYQAHFDALTELANRRYFNEFLDRAWKHSMREQIPLSIIMLDVDKFKVYNDHYGHPGGDACLRKVAEAIRQVVNRPLDLAARYGGEEFIVILEKTTAEAALVVAEKIRQAVIQLALPHEYSQVEPVVTVSLGVACCVPSRAQSSSELLNQADQALYQAKQQGRNRCVAYGGPA